MKKLENLDKKTRLEKAILWLFASKQTKEKIKDILHHKIYRDKEEVRKILMKPFFDFCRINKEKFYGSEIGIMVRAFNGCISGSTLYKGDKAKDIDIFFTDEKEYNEFISLMEKAIEIDKSAKNRNYKFHYNEKQIARYQYVEDQSIIMYGAQKIDVNLVSHFQEIEEILESDPKIMDYFIDLFRTDEWKEEDRSIMDMSKFNPETKSFGYTVKGKKSVRYDVYKIPNDIKPPYKNINDISCGWSAGL